MYTPRQDFIRNALRFHHLVVRRRPGSRADICRALNITCKELEGIRDFLLQFGADIHYDRKERRYSYRNNFTFELGAKF